MRRRRGQEIEKMKRGKKIRRGRRREIAFNKY